MTMDSQGAASQMIAAATAFKDHLDAMGAGVAIFCIGADEDSERWAVAVVLGRENVEALHEWNDDLVAERET